MVMEVPDKRDLIYLNFSPQSGHEQSGHRPAIVLSPKLFNQNTFLIACPITNQEKGYPFEVKIPSRVKGERCHFDRSNKKRGMAFKKREDS